MTKDNDDFDNSELVRKVEQFSKAGMGYQQKGQRLEALKAFRSAYYCSVSIGYKGYMQRACAFNLGAALIASKNYSEGLEFMQQATPPEGLQDGKSNGDLYFNIALAKKGIQNISESMKYLEKAIEEYRQEQNDKMECDAIHLLEKMYFKRGYYQEAEIWLQQLKEIYKRLKQKEQLLIVDLERVNIYLKTDRCELAEEITDKSWEKAKRLDPSENIVRLYHEIALVYCQLEKYDKAEECYKSAPKVFCPKLKALLSQNIGALLNQKGMFSESLESHKKAIQKYRELNNIRSECHCCINLGYAYSQLNQIDKAGDCYNEALQASRKCGDKKSEWQCLESLGAVACNQGCYKIAQDYYKQALSVYLGMPMAVDKDIQDRILGKLTNILKLQYQEPKSSAKKFSRSKDPSKISTNLPKITSDSRADGGNISHAEIINQEENEDADDEEDRNVISKPIKDLASYIESEKGIDSSSKEYYDYDENEDEEDENERDKKAVFKEMAKHITSNYESERDIDSSSIEYYDSSETEMKSMKKSSAFASGSYEKEIKGPKASGTYEKPLYVYETAGTSKSFDRTGSHGKSNSLRGHNYFRDDVNDSSSEPKRQRKESTDTSENEKTDHDSNGDESNTEKKEQENLKDMPVGKRDDVLYKKHIEMTKKKNQNEGKKKESHETNKKTVSKTCIVM